MSRRLISIIAPVRNEAWSLAPLYGKFIQLAERIPESLELVFVNDGSTDGSAALLDELAAKDTRVKVLHLKRNFGITAALMAGFDYAAGEVFVTLDANLQHDPNDIPLLLTKLDEGYDVCSGWRKDRPDSRFSLQMPNRLANWIISKIAGIPLNDYRCSFKAYRRTAVAGLTLYGESYRFLALYAAMQGARLAEVPITQHPRVHGHGGGRNGVKSLFKFMLDIIVVKYFLDYSQRPIYIFGFWGLINFALSVLATLAAMYYKFWGGKSFIETPLPTLVVFTSLMGLMCILIGILAEIVMRVYFDTRKIAPYAIQRLSNLEPR